MNISDEIGKATAKKKRPGSTIALLSVVLILLMLIPSLEVYGTNQSSLTINSVTHNVQPISGNNKFSDVVTDSMGLSGKTDRGSQVVVQKIERGKVSEKVVSANRDGSFSTSVDFTIGPDFLYEVNSGRTKLKVISTASANAVDVSLVDNSSVYMGSTKETQRQASVTRGQPRTFVVYHNSYYFNIGYYIDDNGNAVRGSKDDVAAQLSKFSFVSLYYTESAQNIGLIKAHNPNVKIFAYFNPEFCYVSEDPNSEFQKVVVHHPEWVLKDINGAAITSYNGTEQVMDLTHPGWRGEAVRLCREALTTKGFDGLYLDDGVNDPAWGFDVWQNANTTSLANWHAALNLFYEQVRVPGKLQFYNGQSPLMDSSMQDYLNRNDGWMDEGYISYKGWMKSAIEMPQFASAQKRFSIFYANNPDGSVRHFYYMSALLSDGYFFYAPTSTKWFNEYGFRLGKPMGKAYQLNDYPGIWARDFAQAKVFVNPTPNNITISATTLNGNYRTLDGKPISSITIDKFDGEIIVPEYAVTVQLAPQYQKYFQWELTNYGNTDTWVAPYAIFYAPTVAPPYYSKGGTITGFYYVDGGAAHTALRHAGLGWVHLSQGKTVSVYSQACVPSNAKWSVYNVYMYYNKGFRGWLYPKWDQNAQLR
jgi:hypothetical protein